MAVYHEAYFRNSAGSPVSMSMAIPDELENLANARISFNGYHWFADFQLEADAIAFVALIRANGREPNFGIADGINRNRGGDGCSLEVSFRA